MGERLPPDHDGVTTVHSPRTLGRSLAHLLVLALLALGLTAAGTQSARAADYPVATFGEGTVSASVVEAGKCVIFSGGGFVPKTTITTRDNGVVVGTTRARGNGQFSTRVCFGTDAGLGRHTLTATGTGANGGPRTVTAFVTVVGAQQSSSGSGRGGSTLAANDVNFQGGSGNGAGVGSSVLPFTGADIRTLSLLGLALLLLGGFLTRRGHVARAQRRAARAAT